MLHAPKRVSVVKPAWFRFLWNDGMRLHIEHRMHGRPACCSNLPLNVDLRVQLTLQLSWRLLASQACVGPEVAL